MKEEIKTMIRLQELEIIAYETRIMAGLVNPANLSRVEQKIADLKASLSERTLSRYEKLRESGMAVAKEYGGTCQHCRMTLTIPVLNRMRNNETDWICPNCGHFLNLS